MSAPAAVSEARTRAAHVLVRVWVDRAYAAAALDAELSAMSDPRDVGLVTELVYGVLRTQGYLEAELAALSQKGKAFDHPEALAHLLIGMYSIAFLDRVPAFAAVSEAVTGVTAAIGPKPAGFTNAVLRAFARKMEQGERPSQERAALEGAAGWLRGALRRSLGRKGAEAFLAAGPVPPPLGIAVATPDSRSRWLAELTAAAPQATLRASELSPVGLVAQGVGAAPRLPGFERDWIIQEEGAQVVTLACGPKPGDRVLDACAGRGNKSWLLSQWVGELGFVTAVDKYPEKVARFSARSPHPARTRGLAIDWLSGAGGLGREFDWALVDAPCSGVGTLRRRPEVGLFRDPDSIAGLAQDQLAICARVAPLVKQGGHLIYAVCSVLREESELVVDQLLAQSRGSLEPAPFDPQFQFALVEGSPHLLRLFPHVHGTDGYFAARLRVVS